MRATLLACVAVTGLAVGPVPSRDPIQAPPRPPTVAPLPDKEWKRWVDDVGPLLLQPDRDELKVIAPSQRRAFREEFWLARNPNPASPDNTNRADYERRVAAAERRFRPDGRNGWNDCGRTYLLLGTPDRMVNERGAQHFAGSDPLRAAVEEENTATETWIYRNSPRLPPSPEGFVFRFTASCDAVASPSADKLLERAAISYLTPRR